MREKRRYLLARIDPAGAVPEQKDLYYAISEAVTTLWGDGVAAMVVPAVVALEDGHVVIRYRRGADRELMIALSTVTAVREMKIALRPIAISGTIASLRLRIKKSKPAVPKNADPGDPGESGEPGEVPEVTFAGKKFMALQCEGKKVNLIEKGFKNTNRLFLTSEDMEES